MTIVLISQLLKFDTQFYRWADEEEKCAEFVQKLIEHFGKKVLNEQKREKTPLIFSVEYGKAIYIIDS